MRESLGAHSAHEQLLSVCVLMCLATERDVEKVFGHREHVDLSLQCECACEFSSSMMH